MNVQPLDLRQTLACVGGVPVRTRPWPTYDKGNVMVDADDIKAAERVLSSRLLFRYDNRRLEDTEVGKFELEIAAFFGSKHALAVSSGTAAIALSLMAIGLKHGDEVLCSAFGFPASVSAVILAGGWPVLVEVDSNLHVDVSDLERKISPRTKAILVIHMRGQAGDIRSVIELANDRGIPVVEDAVPIMGAKLDGRFLGTFGKFGAFSTQSDKSLNTGEGGFLLTNDTHLFQRAVILSGAYEGRAGKHFEGTLSAIESDLPLFNFRMDEIRGLSGISCRGVHIRIKGDPRWHDGKNR